MTDNSNDVSKGQKKNQNNNEFEEHRFLLEKEKFHFEKEKTILQYVTIFITIVISCFTAYKSLKEYQLEKAKQNDQAYFKALADLENESLIIQRAALLELCRFSERYNVISPILIDFLVTKKKKNDTSLDRSFVLAIFNIGQPIIRDLITDNSHFYGEDENRNNAIQWAIGEIIKKGISNKVGYSDFNNITLMTIELKNLMIRNISMTDARLTNMNFNGTIFSNVNFSGTYFKNCTFWQSKFNANTDLTNVIFENCTFEETYFECDLNHAEFSQSICRDICITKQNYFNNNTFSNAAIFTLSNTCKSTKMTIP